MTIWNGITIAPTKRRKIILEVRVFVRTNTHAATEETRLISIKEKAVINILDKKLEGYFIFLSVQIFPILMNNLEKLSGS